MLFRALLPVSRLLALRTLALGDLLSVCRAKLILPDRPPAGVDAPRDRGRSGSAAPDLARRVILTRPEFDGFDVVAQLRSHLDRSTSVIRTW
jgi:hypothetical protein